MIAYTWELKSHNQLKRILELSLRLNGFDVQLNPSGSHKLQKGQEQFEPPIRTIIMKTESGWCKFLHDERDGYGKVNMPEVVAESLINELELRLLTKGGDNAKSSEDKAKNLQEEV